eukprot:SAG11_NODE_8683_length_987_cov_1.623874_2_plen_157_part_01
MGIGAWHPVANSDDNSQAYHDGAVVRPLPELDEAFIARESEDIVIDGNLGDWASQPYVSQTHFEPWGSDPDPASTSMVEFETYDGGVWSGFKDQSSAVSFAWTNKQFLVAVKVIDDTHQFDGTDGDSVQLVVYDDRKLELGAIYVSNFAVSDADIGD